MQMPKVIVTSVVRGSQQGESHGGIFIVDVENNNVEQRVDWNSGDIDFTGRGADRGLRGITFDGDDIYVAASDELFCYNREFKIQKSWKNPYLKHCHEIVCKDRTIFLTSTGFDSLLAFDINRQVFSWGLHLMKQREQWTSFTFDPLTDKGPRAVNRHHLNMVQVNNSGIYMSGLKAEALLHVHQQNQIEEICNLPSGTHNAQTYQGGVLFNDTVNDYLRFVSPNRRSEAFAIRQYKDEEIQFSGIDDSKIARQGFARGLCTFGERIIIGGSSPSTITYYDITTGKAVTSINLTMDIRNAIHGLEIWPFD
ncbi:MAG: hypothetical protein HRT37_22345 [Alteromonadaceae bacterium]|nr:hypothetical protein [Alteromonadaceae bacterium]